jgi:CDP-glycerol glycerophosphotransferase (TagB/SpsB family)
MRCIAGTSSVSIVRVPAFDALTDSALIATTGRPEGRWIGCERAAVTRGRIRVGGRGSGRTRGVSLATRNLRRYAAVPLGGLLWPVARSVPRKPGRWAFAYIHGYKDNPRYLFEHVVDAAPPGIEPVWLAQTRAEAEAVQATGRPAVWKRSPRGWWANLRAGAVFLGNGPSELNRPLMGRTMVVQSWHGAPFKKIHADFEEQDVLVKGGGALGRLVNAAIGRVTSASRSRVDLVPSQSAIVATRFQSAFRVGPEATPVLGTPRADVICATGPEADAELAQVLDQVLPERLRSAQRIVFYAPTWRDGRPDGFLADGFDVDALDAMLARHDAVLLLKLHPYADRDTFDQAGIGRSERVLLGAADGVDVNVLLRGVDVLLTDYSAISVDYALLERPIVYFMPDLEEYVGGRGLYESPEVMTGGLHRRTWPEVVTALDEALTEPEPYVVPVRAAAERYCAFRDTESCARIVAEARRRLGC